MPSPGLLHLRGHGDQMLPECIIVEAPCLQPAAGTGGIGEGFLGGERLRADHA